MELSDLWLKMAKNETLTPQELDFLRMQGKNTQQNNAQTAGNTSADGSANFIRPFIESPIWRNALNSTVFDTSLTVDTATETELNINQVQTRSPSRIFTLGSNGKKVKISTQNNFLVCGNLVFSTDATGLRQGKLAAYTTTGAINYYTLFRLPSVSGDNCIVPFSYLFDRYRDDVYNDVTTIEVSIFAYQNSGSSLGVTGKVGFMEV